MRSLADLPDHIKATLTSQEKAAIEMLVDENLEVYYQYETGLFDCIGFIGPGGKYTKPANIEKYNAILILENRIKRELAGLI